MEEAQLESFSALAQFAERFSIGDWIFRGVADRDYFPQPVIGRRGARRSLHGADLEFDQREATKALELFIRQARPHCNLSRSSNGIEWLALARHHGLPTQLLDWTTSPLIAAHFACDDGGVHRDEPRSAAIFAVRLPPTVRTLEEALASDQVTSYFPDHISPRIVAQQGLFTFHPDPSTPWRPEKLIRFEIASEAAIAIKRVLVRCGIGPAHVFPDLDGIGRDLAWRYKRQFLEEIRLQGSAEGSSFSYGGPAGLRGDRFIEQEVDGAIVMDGVSLESAPPAPGTAA